MTTVATATGVEQGSLAPSSSSSLPPRRPRSTPASTNQCQFPCPPTQHHHSPILITQTLTYFDMEINSFNCVLVSPLQTIVSPRTPTSPLGPLNIPLYLFGTSSSPVLPYKSSENLSNVSVDPMGPPISLPSPTRTPRYPPWPLGIPFVSP